MQPLRLASSFLRPISSRATGCRAVFGALIAVISISTAGAIPPATVTPVKVPVAVVSLESTAASELDARLIAEAKERSEIMANLGYLSDVIGPRLTGSRALKRANYWAAEKMIAYGLDNVHLEGWTIPVGWERGTAYARIVEPENGRTLTMAANGWTPGTKGKIVGDVVVLSVKNSKELAGLKGKLKNAIVLRGEPRAISDTNFASGGARPPTPNRPFGGVTRGDAGWQEMMALYRETMNSLRSEGVAAVLQDAGKPHGLLTTSGGWRGQDRAEAGDPVPSLYVAHEHYALLYRLATRAAPARTRVEIEVHNTFIPGPIAVYNTVGEIRGSEKPDEFVVVGAHLDSWDLAQGTTDNGTGSSVVLETARIISRCGIKPKRTIRFALFSGEEQGLHGSRAYVQQHKDELDRISMCLVHDTGTGKVVSINLQGRESLKPMMEPILAGLKDLGVTEFSMRSFGGSDHMSFDREGVPGLMLSQDMSGYRYTHHSQSDTYDKAREPDLIQGAQVMAVTAMRVANLPDLLPREKRTTRPRAAQQNP
jgi:hypothetical protein